MDKIKELDLHLEAPDVISVPGIQEFPITLECRVVYKQDQDLSKLDEDKYLRYYKPGTPNDGDFHTAYYGEVLAAYIIED
jgi:flavin reductase (DIM6/NTAB) family NADH-FMN oxidoreductase RutF